MAVSIDMGILDEFKAGPGPAVGSECIRMTDFSFVFRKRAQEEWFRWVDAADSCDARRRGLHGEEERQRAAELVDGRKYGAVVDMVCIGEGVSVKSREDGCC